MAHLSLRDRERERREVSREKIAKAFRKEGGVLEAKEAFEIFLLDGPDTRGWYWWACWPGCMPDGEPGGPFATLSEALADADERHPDWHMWATVAGHISFFVRIIGIKPSIQPD